MARTNLASGGEAVSRFSYATATFAPVGDCLLLAFVLNASGGLLPPVPVVPAAVGNGLTWEIVETGVTGPAGRHRLTCFRAMLVGSSPTPGSLALSFAGQAQALCAWTVVQFSGVDTNGTNGSGAIAQHLSGTATATTQLALPLTAFADPAKNIAVGAIGLDGASSVTTGPAFTTIDVQTPNTGLGRSGTLQTQDHTGGAASAQWTWSGGTRNAIAIALEIKAQAPIVPVMTDDPEQLVRKFEPILFFDRLEANFPCDAKRYVENAALWTASGPMFDTKSSWGGGTGQPFPRHPVYGAGDLWAEDDGQPHWIGAAGNRDSDEREHFLEFGGWIDKSDVAQPMVTSASQNSYADQDGIQHRYVSEQPLADSQFWYHAEFLDTARLRSLAATVAAPDLGKVAETFSNPALLCYYFLFPGHQQAPDNKCANIEAKEYAGFAGQWAAITLLLERDDPGQEYAPSLVGYTGSRTPEFHTSDGNVVRLPQAFDDEERGNLKVYSWRSGRDAHLPELIDGHPAFYVSLGTHSLYMTPGAHPVDPFPEYTGPANCGVVEAGTISFAPSHMPSAGVVLAKFLALGVFGLTAWAMEALGSGSEMLFASGDAIPDDQAPAKGAGPCVHPVGVTVPGAGPYATPWRSAQGAAIDGRRYDFLVDRSIQGWWPSYDGRSGYSGRWGQRVEDDPNNLRAGMRFPPFWKMFLSAVEYGRSTKQLPRRL